MKPFTMFFSLACLVNCSKLVKLTYLETTEKKIEVWWKTKKNPKKYYWILNSKEPTPSFLKYYLFTLALFPSTLHFSMAKSTGPQLFPQIPSQWSLPGFSPRVQAAFTRIKSKMQFEKVGEFMIASGSWQVGRLELEVNFFTEELDFFDWANGGGEGSHDILVCSYRDSTKKWGIYGRIFFCKSITVICTPRNQVFSSHLTKCIQHPEIFLKQPTYLRSVCSNVHEAFSPLFHDLTWVTLKNAHKGGVPKRKPCPSTSISKLTLFLLFLWHKYIMHLCRP